ncbi:MAG TPA: glycoside hydrolase family 172 protein [Chryseosolibacter sp.]
MKPLLFLILFASVASVNAQELFEIPSGRQTRWISFENPSGAKGAGGKENKGAKGHAFDVVEPGGSRVMVDYKGAGIIKRIWLTVNERSPQALRSMKIEMYWDNNSTPAVSVPLGDFFGIGLGRKVPFESEFFSDPEGRSFNCSIPMPFKTAARIVLVNEWKTPVMFFYDVNMTTVARHEKDVFYFHAFWNRENKTKVGKDYTVLPSVKGRGRFLGMNVGVIADTIYETSWWGEGEVKMYLDGDTNFPTLIGTGTEDYIGTAWGQGQYAHRYQGCPLADEKNKQWSFYRYHVPDPVYFNNSLSVMFQQIGGEMTDFVRRLKKKGAVMRPVSVAAGDKFYKLFDMNPIPDLMDSTFPQGWTNYYREDDFSSTAYFYLDKPMNGLPALQNVQQRTRNLLEDKK